MIMGSSDPTESFGSLRDSWKGVVEFHTPDVSQQITQFWHSNNTFTIVGGVYQAAMETYQGYLAF